MEGRLEGTIKMTGGSDPGNRYDYVWKATFEDGSIINQLDGKKGDDALNFKRVMAMHDKLVDFTLRPNNLFRRGHKISVDVRTGIITVNGQEFLPYWEMEPLPPSDCVFKLEWWRRNYDTRGMVGVTPTGYHRFRSTYYIGWSTTWQGKEIKRMIRIYFDGQLGIG